MSRQSPSTRVPAERDGVRPRTTGPMFHVKHGFRSRAALLAEQLDIARRRSRAQIVPPTVGESLTPLRTTRGRPSRQQGIHCLISPDPLMTDLRCAPPAAATSGPYPRIRRPPPSTVHSGPRKPARGMSAATHHHSFTARSEPIQRRPSRQPLQSSGVGTHRRRRSSPQQRDPPHTPDPDETNLDDAGELGCEPPRRTGRHPSWLAWPRSGDLPATVGSRRTRETRAHRHRRPVRPSNRAASAARRGGADDVIKRQCRHADAAGQLPPAVQARLQPGSAVRINRTRHHVLSATLTDGRLPSHQSHGSIGRPSVHLSTRTARVATRRPAPRRAEPVGVSRETAGGPAAGMADGGEAELSRSLFSQGGTRGSADTQRTLHNGAIRFRCARDQMKSTVTR